MEQSVNAAYRTNEKAMGRPTFHFPSVLFALKLSRRNRVFLYV